MSPILCRHCKQLCDPLQLCDCPDAMADFIAERGVPQRRELLVKTLRDAGIVVESLKKRLLS